MTPKIPSTIQQAFFEYSATYSEPSFDVIGLNTRLKAELFKAFREWNVTLANFTARTSPANDSEVQLNVGLLGGNALFKAGFGSCGVVHTRPTWQDLDAVSRIASCGVNAVKASMGVTISKQEAVIAMHVKPSARSLHEITAPLVSVPRSGLPPGEIRCFGVSAYTKDSTWTVDASVIHKDALFIRLWRSFDAKADFQSIGAILKQDEDRVLGVLSLEVD